LYNFRVIVSSHFLTYINNSLQAGTFYEKAQAQPFLHQASVVSILTKNVRQHQTKNSSKKQSASPAILASGKRSVNPHKKCSTTPN